MKNKKLLYVLIPVVLFIWGTVIFKIFNVVHTDDSNASFNKASIGTIENENLIDTFSIHPDYPDPFLGRHVKKSNPDETKVSKAVEKLIENKKNNAVTIVWPKLVYSGLIKNQKSKKQLALVQIEGRSNIMKIGDIAEDIELVKILRDSIEVKFQGEKKFVWK